MGPSQTRAHNRVRVRVRVRVIIVVRMRVRVIIVGFGVLTFQLPLGCLLLQHRSFHLVRAASRKSLDGNLNPKLD